MITLTSYCEDHEQGAEKLVAEIRDEYTLPPPDPSYNPPSPDKYWVALYNNEVIGTAGLNLPGDYGVLKRMFVKREFRGHEKNVAGRLLEEAFKACFEKNVSTMYLGTMDVFVAAHRFYEKNGFTRIQNGQLPSDFPNNPVDNVFYFKQLKNDH